MKNNIEERRKNLQEWVEKQGWYKVIKEDVELSAKGLEEYKRLTGKEYKK